MQEMDERRILKIQESVFQCAEIEKNVIPIINTCIEGIAKAAGNINPSQVRFGPTWEFLFFFFFHFCPDGDTTVAIYAPTNTT